MFKKAIKIKLFDEKGQELKDYKAVANEKQTTQIFSIVKNGYQIIQHEEVSNTVNEAIKDKKLNAKIREIFLNVGGRLHIEVTFPEISLDIEENGLPAQLYCTYDNSYDGSTGLRLSVGARRGSAVLWILGSRYYHKHTKSVSVAEFEKELDKGIESFQNKIKKHFLEMLKTPLSNERAFDFIENSASKIKNVSKKYIEAILLRVRQSTIRNKWQLYCLICDVISKEASSIDVRDRHLRDVISRMHREIKTNEDNTAVKHSSSEGSGQTEEIKDISSEESSPSVALVCSSDLTSLEPSDSIGLPSFHVPLTIKKINRKKFMVMQGEKRVRTFRKQKQAEKFVQEAA